MVEERIMSWEPSQSDIDWQRRLLGMCSEGAVWGANSGIYLVKKEEQKLVRTFPGTSEATHERIKIVLNKLGWTMEDECKQSS
jgi:hypothetical protein